jgi:hypothetical protein
MFERNENRELGEMIASLDAELSEFQSWNIPQEQLNN